MKDLERALEQIHVHESEEHKVYAYQRRSWYDQLDQRDQQRAFRDFAALDEATARHEQLRNEAEKELQKYYREVEEEERRKKEAEERRIKEQQAREKADRERKEREEAARRAAAAQKAKEEAERKAAEARAKAEAEERVRKEREDTAAREKAEQERKAKEVAEKEAAEERARKEAEERAKQAQLATPAAPATTAPATSTTQASSSAELEAKHRRYLEIHQNLKKFRRTFWEECKKNKDIKTAVGDLRRTIKTAVGQLVEITSENPGANRAPTLTIRKKLMEALKINAPSVPLNEFMADQLSSNPPPQVPAILVYALNIFSKAVISQFSNESGVNPRAAEPAGILVANVFANPDNQYSNGDIKLPLIDILLAKYHMVCPVLFGISGPESTTQGKLRIGWRREAGALVTEHRHGERQQGLGAGFAAVSLRNFAKSANKNPYPPSHYWESFANIVNTPSHQVQPTHLLVLKGMIENSCDRFIMFFNVAGIAALRYVFGDWIPRLPAGLRKHPACEALILLPETLERDRNIRIFD